MADPSSSPAQTIDVIAPSDLPEGYQFQVDAGGGKLYTVQVPPGGVITGQRFAAIVVVQHQPPMSSNVPRGHWRDKWTDCFNHVNAQCLLGCFCSPCAVGQVMTRMNLDWKAERFTQGEESKPSLSTFKIVVIITAAYHIIGRIFAVSGIGWMESLVAIAMMVYVTLITCRTRKTIRHTYDIPVTTCGHDQEDLEDCCCSFWCNPCTACHMARHLNDFDQYPAQCCTDTGLGPEAPPLPEFALAHNSSSFPNQNNNNNTNNTNNNNNNTQSPPPFPPPPPQQPEQTQPPPQQPQTQSPPPPTTDQPDDYDRENEKTFIVDL